MVFVYFKKKKIINKNITTNYMNMGCYGGILLNGLFLKVFYKKKKKKKNIVLKLLRENNLLLELIFIRTSSN
jgi:hypothetical protein